MVTDEQRAVTFVLEFRLLFCGAFGIWTCALHTVKLWSLLSADACARKNGVDGHAACREKAFAGRLRETLSETVNPPRGRAKKTTRFSSAPDSTDPLA